MQFTFKHPPMAHQKEFFDLFGKREAVEGAALWGPGTGKSAGIINVLRYKFALHGSILRTIIFTLPTVVEGWVDQWLEHSSIERKRLVPLVGSQKKRIETFLKFKDTPCIFITNYEALLMKDLYKLLQAWLPQALVFDESHKVKSPKAQTSNQAFDLANPKGAQKPYTYIATGSAISNSPLDIFQQFKILDGGKTFGKNFFAFRAQFFRDRNATMPKDRYFPKWECLSLEKDGVDGKALIGSYIAKRGTVKETEDCIDLPEEQTIPIKVPFSKEQERLYKEMKNDLITFYNSQACIGALAITKALRLMQISSGFVSTRSNEEDEQYDHQLKDVPRLQILKDLLITLTEGGHKVLIWAVWKYNYKQIRQVCDELGLKYVELHGEISPTQKDKNQNAFRDDPEIKIMIGHPGSGGVGTNKLMGAKYSVVYSRNFSLIDFEQSRARNRRQGSKALFDKVVYYELVSPGIEETTLDALRTKKEIKEDVLGSVIQRF